MAAATAVEADPTVAVVASMAEAAVFTGEGAASTAAALAARPAAVIRTHMEATLRQVFAADRSAVRAGFPLAPAGHTGLAARGDFHPGLEARIATVAGPAAQVDSEAAAAEFRPLQARITTERPMASGTLLAGIARQARLRRTSRLVILAVPEVRTDAALEPVPALGIPSAAHGV